MSRAALVFIIAGVIACADNPPVVYPTAASLDESKLPLGPGDKIHLTIFYGAHSINAPYTLDASGELSVQFIGSVKAGGKTSSELQKEIQQRLADGFLQNPIVSVNLVELNSLTLSVSGMVAKTGSVKFSRNMTITDVIVQVGGFTPMARKNMVKVTRVVNGGLQTYKLPVEKMIEGERPNFPVLPGDTVFVPERAW